MHPRQPAPATPVDYVERHRIAGHRAAVLGTRAAAMREPS
jgi:hypothetical protein